jgi:hypothetical protein
MSALSYMKIDIRDTIEQASDEKSDRRTESFHLSKRKVARFKKSCKKLKKSSSKLLEVFMDQVSNFAGVPEEKDKKE